VKKFVILFLIIFSQFYFAQSAYQIVKKANALVMGKTSTSLSKMTIIRPGWSREVTIKMWSKGNDYYMICGTGCRR